MTFVKKILSNKDHRLILKNFFNYGIFQFSNYLIPLITIPYIIRVIGVEKFGIISLAQALAYYFRVIIEYGFPISGVQYIAQNQKSIQKKSEIYSNIIFIQSLLMLGGLLILFGIAFVFSEVRQEWIVYFAAFGIVPANILMALWYYIGSERMKYLNYINFSGRIIYIVLIFVFIHTQSDYILVPVINSGSLILAGLVSVFILKKNFNISFLKPNMFLFKKYLKDGWPLFVSNFAISFYRNSNILILGLFASNEVVGIYSAVEKIIKIIQNVFSPLTNTLYPYISRVHVQSSQRSFDAIAKVIKVMALISALIVAGLIVFAPWVVLLVVGHAVPQANSLLRIGSVVVLVGVINYIIGIIFMTNFGLKKEFSKAVVTIGILNLFVCTILSKFYGALGTVVAFTMAELLLFILLTWMIQRKSQWRVIRFFLP